MIKKKTWEEFRKTGLLWFVNVIIHVFGWAIVVEVEDGKIIDSYPARVNLEDSTKHPTQSATRTYRNT